MGSEPCRWDSPRTFYPMVPALPRALSMSVGASSHKARLAVGRASMSTYRSRGRCLDLDASPRSTQNTIERRQ